MNRTSAPTKARRALVILLLAWEVKFLSVAHDGPKLPFIIGLALPLAAMNLFFRDIRYLVGVVVYLWFFFTPIFYSTAIVPAKYTWVYDINPNARIIERIIEAYRYAILENVAPPITSVLFMTALSLPFLIGGYFAFKKMEAGFADYI